MFQKKKIKNVPQLVAFGSNVRRYRRFADLTQQELAEKMGVTGQYISQIERGLVDGKVSLLLRIADGIGCDASALLSGANYQSPAYFAEELFQIQQTLLPNSKKLLCKIAAEIKDYEARGGAENQ